MGDHKGWTVGQVRGAHVGRVREDGRYRSRSFPTKSAATRWAQDQANQLRLQPAAVAAAGTRTAALAKAYLADLERRGRVATHIRDTKWMLDQLAQHVGDLGAKDATEAIERWLGRYRRPDTKAKRARPLSARTRNKYLVAVKSLCNWAVERHRLDRSPAAVIGEEKEPDRLRAQLSVDELRHLLAQRDDPYHLTFAVYVFAGLRAAEAEALRGAAADVAGGWMRVVGKGNKERLVPIQAQLAPLIAVRKRACPRPEARLCPRLSAAAGRDFKRFLKRHQIGVNGRSPHSCRHTYAGLMTATGVPSLLLAEYLGHASTGTTAKYSRLAARYVAQVSGWPRGEFQLMTAAPVEDFRAE